MQDLSTGELKELTGSAFEEFKASIPLMEFQPHEALEKLKDSQGALQSAKDAAIPIREHQGPTFAIGEIVEVKGGMFRVSGITSKRLYLDSLPAKLVKPNPSPRQIKEALIARIVRDSKPGDPTEEEIRRAIEESERTPRMIP